MIGAFATQCTHIVHIVHEVSPIFVRAFDERFVHIVHEVRLVFVHIVAEGLCTHCVRSPGVWGVAPCRARPRPADGQD